MPPVDVVPAEVLGVIFRLLVDAKLDRDSRRFPQVLCHHRSRLRILITTSHVCKRWRVLVLGDGTLWAWIPIESSRHDCWESMECILKRSKQAELDVSVLLDASRGISSEAMTAMVALGAQYTRVRSLYLSTDSPVSLFCGPNPATAMHTLEVFNRSKLYYPVAKFLGAFPNLRSLTLHGFSSWSSDAFSNLLHIRLSAVSANNSFRLSRLIALLRTSPDLETVHLSSYLSIVDDLPLTDVVYLRNLRKMSLRTCDSAAILSHVVIPRTSTLDIVMDHRRLRAIKPLPSHETSIISSLPSRMNNMQFSTETTKLILEQGVNRSGFGLGLSFYDSRTPSLVIIDRSLSIQRFVQKSLGAISSNPYFETIRRITITLPPSTLIHWPTFLGNFKHLLELDAWAHHGPATLAALTHLFPGETPLCPSLRRIRFFGGDPVVNTIPGYRLLQLSNFRATHGCGPIKVTVYDGKGGPGVRIYKCT